MACWQTTCAFDRAWCRSARLYGDRGRCHHNERSFHRYSREILWQCSCPIGFCHRTLQHNAVTEGPCTSAMHRNTFCNIECTFLNVVCTLLFIGAVGKSALLCILGCQMQWTESAACSVQLWSWSASLGEMLQGLSVTWISTMYTTYARCCIVSSKRCTRRSVS